MEFKDYYKILGVAADADAAVIKTAYRKLARKYHPDMNPDKGAEEKFKEVAEAYHVLKNPQTRAEFDELRELGGQQPHGFQMPPGWQNAAGNANQGSPQFDGDYSDFFNSIFGGRQQKKQNVRGRDVEVELPMMLEDTIVDFVKTIEFYLPDQEDSHSAKVKKHLKVTIPKGTADGEIIRLKAQGWPGGDGAVAGDLYLHIRVIPHPLFEVEGHNLLLTLPLAPWEAALGTKVMVPTLSGNINLTIALNTPAGKKLRIKGKGLSRHDGQAGDLFVIVKLVLPVAINEKTKELWQQLATQETFNPRAQWSRNYE